MKRVAYLHCGLHKTASTYLQAVCRQEWRTLAKHGVYFQAVDGYPAHHEIAWSLLRGETHKLDQLVSETPSECVDLLVSSEDLENLLLFPDKAELITEHLTERAGISTVEFLFVVRDAGDYFVSIMAEMSKHGVYLDYLHAFDEVMRTGRLYVPKEEQSRGIPNGWTFVFDTEKFISRFAQRVNARVSVFSYDEGYPFPSAQIIHHVTGGKAGWLGDLKPGKLMAWRNCRIALSRQNDAYAATIVDRLYYCEERSRIMDWVVSRRLPQQEIELLRQTISKKFRTSGRSSCGSPV